MEHEDALVVVGDAGIGFAGSGILGHRREESHLHLLGRVGGTLQHIGARSETGELVTQRVARLDVLVHGEHAAGLVDRSAAEAQGLPEDLQGSRLGQVVGQIDDQAVVTRWNSKDRSGNGGRVGRSVQAIAPCGNNGPVGHCQIRLFGGDGVSDGTGASHGDEQEEQGQRSAGKCFSALNSHGSILLFISPG